MLICYTLTLTQLTQTRMQPWQQNTAYLYEIESSTGHRKPAITGHAVMTKRNDTTSIHADSVLIGIVNR